MSTKQQDFRHKRKEEDCFVTLQFIQPLAVKTLHTDIFNKSGQVMSKNAISLCGCREMKWPEMKADSALSLLLNVSPLFFYFEFLHKFTNYAENEFLCDSGVRLSPLPSVPISCEWNMWRGTFISHGSGSHNLIHLYDKLHYEGGQ